MRVIMMKIKVIHKIDLRRGRMMLKKIFGILCCSIFLVSCSQPTQPSSKPEKSAEQSEETQKQQYESELFSLTDMTDGSIIASQKMPLRGITYQEALSKTEKGYDIQMSLTDWLKQEYGNGEYHFDDETVSAKYTVQDKEGEMFFRINFENEKFTMFNIQFENSSWIINASQENLSALPLKKDIQKLTEVLFEKAGQ